MKGWCLLCVLGQHRLSAQIALFTIFIQTQKPITEDSAILEYQHSSNPRCLLDKLVGTRQSLIATRPSGWGKEREKMTNAIDKILMIARKEVQQYSRDIWL